MDVGVRELKQQLSEYLERAARGEIIRITDRGEPKALLTAIPGRSEIARGISEGWLRPPLEAAGSAAPQRFKASQPSADVLDDDRGT